MKKLFKISIGMNTEQFQDCLNGLDKARQYSLYEMYRSIHNISVVEEDGNLSGFAIMTELQLLELQTIVAIIGVELDIVDISDDMIKTRGIDLAKKYNNRWIEFMVVAFLEEYIALDVLLDKIGTVGMEHLDDLDLNMLEHYSRKKD